MPSVLAEDYENFSTGDSCIETDDRSDSCCDCGSSVPTMANDNAYVFEEDGNKGDTEGVQRCTGCSDLFHGITSQ